MATQAESNDNNKTSVLELIQTRLSTLTPQQIAAAAENGPSSEGITVFGVANDDTRRLFALANVFANEHNALAPERRRLESKRRGPGNRFVRLLWEAAGGGLSAEEEERRKDLENEMDLKRLLQELATSMFWLEVRLNFPKATSASALCVCDDWSIGTLPESSFGFEIIHMGLGGDLPEGLPPEVREVIRSIRRHAGH